MTDPKRLPPVYLPLHVVNGVVSSDLEPNGGYLLEYNCCDSTVVPHVEYVPKRECRTCKSWVSGASMPCADLLGPSNCPPDGSGHCHNYEESKGE